MFWLWVCTIKKIHRYIVRIPCDRKQLFLWRTHFLWVALDKKHLLNALNVNVNCRYSPANWSQKWTLFHAILKMLTLFEDASLLKRIIKKADFPPSRSSAVLHSLSLYDEFLILLLLFFWFVKLLKLGDVVVQLAGQTWSRTTFLAHVPDQQFPFRWLGAMFESCYPVLKKRPWVCSTILRCFFVINSHPLFIDLVFVEVVRD